MAKHIDVHSRIVSQFRYCDQSNCNLFTAMVLPQPPHTVLLVLPPELTSSKVNHGQPEGPMAIWLNDHVSWSRLLVKDVVVVQHVGIVNGEPNHIQTLVPGYEFVHVREGEAVQVLDQDTPDIV